MPVVSRPGVGTLLKQLSNYVDRAHVAGHIKSRLGFPILVVWIKAFEIQQASQYA